MQLRLALTWVDGISAEATAGKRMGQLQWLGLQGPLRRQAGRGRLQWQAAVWGTAYGPGSCW